MPTLYVRRHFLSPGLLLGPVCLLLALLLPQAAAAQAWQRALAAGQDSNGFSVVVEVAAAPNGDVYVGGDFTGLLQLGATTLTSAGRQDVFVAKWSSASNTFVWAQRAGGTQDDFLGGLAANGSSVYITGSFSSTTADFGGTTVQNAGVYDIFVAKLTDAGAAGSFAWAQRAGGTQDDEAFDITVSGTNVYVTGVFNSAGAAFGTTQLTPAGSYDMFVTKLTDAGATGSFTWVQQASGPGAEEGVSIAASGADVYVSGVFNGPTASFGSTVLTNLGNTDGFLTRLTDNGSTGSFAWTRQLGGNESDYADAVAVNGDNVYVAGSFISATLSVGTATLVNAGLSDAFVAKFTRDGAFGWAQRAGGPNQDQASAVAVQGSRVYMTGIFEGAASLFGTTALASAGSYDVFVAKLLDAGNSGSFSWAQRAGSPDEDFAGALATNGSSVYVAGGIGGTASFGSQTVALPPNADAAAFLAQLTDADVLAVAEPAWAAGVQLFPNPAHQKATVQVSGTTGSMQLTLLDALGRVLRTSSAAQATAASGAELPLAGLAPGLYQLIIRAGGQQVTRSLAVR